jgi:hypothetical protein
MENLKSNGTWANIKIEEVNSRGFTKEEEQLINIYLQKNKVKRSIKGARRHERHTFEER